MHRSFGFIPGLAAALALGLAVPAVQAQATTPFNLPAQPLAESLRAVAAQTNTNVLFDPPVVAGRSAPALQAQLTCAEALSRLLAGSGLKHEFLSERTVAIVNAQTTGLHPDVTSVKPMSEAKPNSDPQDGRQNGPLVLAQAQTETEGTTTSVESRAAPALEEIVVTAEKRNESIESLPIAISAYSGEMLANTGVENIHNLQQLAPSLQAGMREGSHTRVSIRGIGSDLGTIADEPAVAVHQDGVPYSSLWFYNLDLFDVERVEVLRGPQGTISGRNATAGGIYIHSKRPTEVFEGGMKATVGSYDRLAVDGQLSGPIIADRLLGRLAARRDKDNGWITDTANNQELGTTDKIQVRGSLLAHIHDDLEISLTLDHIRDRSEPLTFVEDGRARPDVPSRTELFNVAGFDRESRTVAHDQPANSATDRDQVALNLAWALGRSANLAATTGYVDVDHTYTPDTDGTIVRNVSWDATDPNNFGARQFSQELTLTADLTDRLDLILGALYLTNRLFNYAPIGLAGAPVDGTSVFDLVTKLSSSSGYTQWRYRLTDEVRLTAGVRYTHDTKTYDDRTFIAGGPPRMLNEKDSWSGWTPRLAVDYAPSNDLTLYASVSRGFKSGGFASFAVPLNPFKPEHVWSFEGGLKANWLDRRLNTALTAFFMDYTDLQQALRGLDATGLVTRVVNANSATIKGAELEIDTLVTDRFRITFAGTWLDATYDELLSHDPLYPELGAPGPVGLNVRDASGNRLVRAPEWKFNVSGEYSAPLGSHLRGVLTASYAWQDQIYFTFFNNSLISQGAYGLINLSAAIATQDAKWKLSAFANNLTDEYYRGQKTGGFVGGSIAHPGLPRTYGVSLEYRF